MNDKTNHPHLEGLIRLRERIRMASIMACGGIPNVEAGGWSDELREIIQALAALPGGGVARVVAHRLHQPNHSSAWISGDYSGPEPKQRGWSVERAYSLPTPNPHEADRNG